MTSAQELVDILEGERSRMLICIQGVSGSGKTTLARLISARLGIPFYEADFHFMKGGEYRFNYTELPQAHRECQEGVRAALESGVSCIVSNTSLADGEIAVYREIAEAAGVRFVLVRTQGEYGNVHGVPDEALKRMHAKLAGCASVPDWIVR